MHFSKYYLFVILSIFLSESLFAQECSPWSRHFLERENLKVGTIKVVTANVFNALNKKENKLIHKLGNKIHIKTRPSIIYPQLLFAEGDDFQFKKLVETERNLRKQHYIKNVRVSPVKLCGNKVNIIVKTSDNWTLTPGLSFSRSSGENRSGIELQENNLFGFGKSVSLRYKKNGERSTKLFYYNDPQLFGSKKRLFLSVLDNSDGKGYMADLSLPFYEFDSKRSWGLSTSKLEQETSLYQAGEVANKITEEKLLNSVFYGWSKDKTKDSVLRFKVGWTFDKTNYLGSSNDLLAPRGKVQESYPWIEFNLIQEHYITKTNFRTMGQIEDISLGRSATVGIGFLHKSLGSDDNHLKLSAAYSKGYELGDTTLGFVKLEGESYLGDGFRQGETVSINAELDTFNDSGNTYSFSGTMKISNNLKLSEQLSLGGEIGLRGYPKAYQTGNKLLLIQAEKRMHFNWYPLRLVKFGAVVFSDIGTVWGKGNDPKILADAGVGLRLVPTRSSKGDVLHIDIATPLVDRGSIDKFQFSLKTSQTF